MALSKPRQNVLKPEQDFTHFNDGAQIAGARATAIRDAVGNARQAAQQQLALARATLSAAREQARAQLKNEELAVGAEESQRQQTLESLQAAIQAEAREYQVKIQSFRNESTTRDAERDKIRIGEVEARKPWTRDDVAGIRPMPLPPIGAN